MEATRVQTLVLVLPSDLQQGRGEETQEELELGQQGSSQPPKEGEPPPGSQRGLWVKIAMSRT